MLLGGKRDAELLFLAAAMRVLLSAALEDSNMFKLYVYHSRAPCHTLVVYHL